MLKAINSSRSIKKTSNNKNNVVVSSVTGKEAFQGRVGGGGGICLTDYA